MTASTLSRSRRPRRKSKSKSNRSHPSATSSSPPFLQTQVPRVEAPDRGEVEGEGLELSLVRRAEAPDAGLARSSECDSTILGCGRGRT